MRGKKKTKSKEAEEGSAPVNREQAMASSQNESKKVEEQLAYPKRTLPKATVRVGSRVGEELPNIDEFEPFILRCHTCKRELLRATNLRLQWKGHYRDYRELVWFEGAYNEGALEFLKELFDYPISNYIFYLCPECKYRYETAEEDLRLFKKMAKKLR
ncbi:MAG: hypothetical protein AB1485_06600 [Candidatus Thermoplasmatota archaeon]